MMNSEREREGRGHGLIEVLPEHLLGGMRKPVVFFTVQCSLFEFHDYRWLLFWQGRKKASQNTSFRILDTF
jgi:hypothetical protein